MSRAPEISLDDLRRLGTDRIVGAGDRAHFERLISPASDPAPKQGRIRGARMTLVDGLKFRSALEARYYEHLKALQGAGVVVRFHRQVEFILDGGVRYFADFVVFYADGRIEYVDVKGHRTEVYILKRKQVEARYGVEIVEVEKW